MPHHCSKFFYGFNTLTSCSKQTTGTAQSFVLLSYYTTGSSQNCTNKQWVGGGVGKRKKRKEGRKICWGQKIKTLKCPWILWENKCSLNRQHRNQARVYSPLRRQSSHTQNRPYVYLFIWIRASSFFTPTVNIQGRTKNELMSNDHHQKGKITTGKGKEAGWMGQEQAYTHECNILQRNLHIPVKKM